MALIPLRCPYCQGTDLAKYGKTRTGKQRYTCYNQDCIYQTFTLEPHTYQGRDPKVKEKIIKMVINGSGIRDTARILGVSTTTVIKELKKRKINRKD